MTSRNDETFNVNIKRLALLVLPTWLRRPLVGALIYAGVTPLGRLAQELRKYRSTTRYRLRHNGQVCKLRSVLNDEFDPSLRRITIEDGESNSAIEASIIYCREEARWVMVPRRDFGAVVIHRDGFSGTSGFDFWVNVPDELRIAGIETRMRAIINTYKLASKRYTINYI
ncbi:MAG: hypothetical protein HDS74_08505 [Bacteroidales bacterium]|nr:hypothetical protein [Bacteroidales bacterium]